MTPQEFNDWLADYCESFPETAAWVNTYGAKVTARWKLAMDSKHVTLAEAKRVTAAMLNGDVEPVAAYERGETSAKIIAAVKEQRAHERPTSYLSESENYEAIKVARQAGDWPAGKIFRAVRARIDAGLTTEDACREVFREFPSGEDSQRFDCNLCWDNSMRCLMVVTARKMSHLFKIGNGEMPITTEAVACTCHHGQRLNRTRHMGLANYDPSRFVLAIGSKEKIRELCLEFVRTSGGRRVSEFDRFNEEEKF